MQAFSELGTVHPGLMAVIGADGGKSKIAQDLGLPPEGQSDLSGAVNIEFDGDELVESDTLDHWCRPPQCKIDFISTGF